MGEALTIRVRRDRGYAVVAVAGEVDIATVTRLRESLFELAASGRSLVVDLDQVSFIDSSGLAALVGAARRAAAHGARLQVVCARPRTRQLFRLTGLDGPVPLARTLDGALESLAAARPAPPLAGGRAGGRPAALVPRPGCRTCRSPGIVGYLLGGPVVAAAGLIAATVVGAAVVAMLSAMLGGHDPRSPFVRLILIVCVITGRRPGDYLPPR